MPGGWKDYGTGSLDLAVEAEPWDGALGFVDLEASGGDGPDADLGTFGGWNGDAGSLQSADGLDRLHVLEAWLATPILRDDLVLTFGKVDLGGFFDPNAVANDETLQFLYGGFVNSAAFEAPDPGPALVMSYTPASFWDFNLACASSDNAGDNLSTDVFSVAQFGFYPELAGLAAECHLTGWSDGARDDLTGMGLSTSLECNESLSVFARWGSQQEKAAYIDAVDTAWSLGLEWREAFGASNTLGFAIGETQAHDDTLDAETAAELYFRHALNDHCAASLHLEHVDQAGGDPAANGTLAVGLRVQIDV